MTGTVSIDGRAVGPGQPCFVVAEIGVNHNGDVALGERLVDAAADVGADAVKLQVFSAERLTTPTAAKAAYQRAADGEGTQREMLQRLELAPDDVAQLARRAASRGVAFLATPFDEGAADLLDTLDVAAFKVSSGDLTNGPLLEHLARKLRPLVLSTGMATLDEVEEAVARVRAAGEDRVVVLHCVSAYPAEAADANLRALETLRGIGVPVGFSDHTLGDDVAVAAVALGACLLEKHLTLDRTLPGPDHSASLEPASFAQLVASVRTVEAALGSAEKRPVPVESETRRLVRRSLAAARDLEPGTVLERDMLVALRPGTGIPPNSLGDVVGRVLTRPIGAGELLEPSHIA